MRISDVSSYVCSSDLARVAANLVQGIQFVAKFDAVDHDSPLLVLFEPVYAPDQCRFPRPRGPADHDFFLVFSTDVYVFQNMEMSEPLIDIVHGNRSAEHTSVLQSLMRISYADFCLKEKPYVETH